MNLAENKKHTPFEYSVALKHTFGAKLKIFQVFLCSTDANIPTLFVIQGIIISNESKI